MSNWYKIAQTEYYNVGTAKTTTDPQILTNILKRGNNDDVSQNAARNPNCPTEMLTEILKKGNNNYVSYYAAGNPNCPPEALVEVLRRKNDNNISYNAVENKNCPPEMLTEILRRGNDSYVSQYAAENTNCPPEILTEVLRRGKDDWVSYYAAKNPNCPPEALVEVLRRGKDDKVSYYAVRNPNCPPEAKIRWMRATGKIGREDPSKGHIVEYDTKEEIIDEDLEKLKKLISKNNNWYKIAQNYQDLPEYYNEEIAGTTTDPQILTNILKKGNNDYVSYYAVSNPNCPPEALIEVLRREKVDSVSRYAAQNPNCPPEALIEALRRGNNDSVSQCAAWNPNCPPEMLVEVLKRGNNDSVSWYASQNPNCPPEAKIRWMRATGKIEREDPSKGHIVEYDTKEEVIDEDLEKLKKLISKNNNWYKIAQSQDYPSWLAKITAEITNNFKETLPPNYKTYIAEIEKWIKETNPDLTNLKFDDAKIYARNYKNVTKLNHPKQIQENINSFFANSQNLYPNLPDFAVNPQTKSKSIPQNIKTKINKELYKLGNYHKEIPLKAIFDICEKYNVIAVQEDGTKWKGMLIGGAECGSDNAINQNANFELVTKIENGEYVPANNVVRLTWCKTSHEKYEIVCYIS